MCVPMPSEEAERLRIRPVVDGSQNTAPQQTAFLMAVDHVNAGTGVSATNRATTIRGLADPASTATDFVVPGHMSPLEAKDGGVLRRAGHTEASVDLMRLSGHRPVGVLIEICSQTGLGMAGLDELRGMAKEYSMPMITIEDLIRYRRMREQLVTRAVEVDIPTRDFGSPSVICYSVAHEDQEPLALVWETSLQQKLHWFACIHLALPATCWTLSLRLRRSAAHGDEMIFDEGVGAIVYLPQEGRGIGLMAKMKAYKLQDQGLDTVEANHRLGFKADMRDYMVGLQILKDLGLSSIPAAHKQSKKTDAFVYSGVDLNVVEQVPIVAPPHECRNVYMETKKNKMGHILPDSDKDK